MAILVLRVGYLCITHPFATKVPEGTSVRLACIRHAASVNPEPGSNSQKVKSQSTVIVLVIFKLKILTKLNIAYVNYSVFKEQCISKSADFVKYKPP